MLRSGRGPLAFKDRQTEDRAIEAAYDAAIALATRLCIALEFAPFREQAEQAVHDWFCQLSARCARTYDPTRPLFPYAGRVLLYILLKQRRNHLRRAARPLEFDPPARRSDPPDELEIEAIIEQLSAPLAQALRMRFLEHLPAAEMGSQLGISVNAVNMRLHHARKILRRMLE